MAKKKSVSISVLLGIILILICHFIYRDIVIRNNFCGCAMVVDYECPEDNREQCVKEIIEYVEKENLKCAREQIHCPFLFNCKCF